LVTTSSVRLPVVGISITDGVEYSRTRGLLGGAGTVLGQNGRSRERLSSRVG
jgi:hypothetical protein